MYPGRSGKLTLVIALVVLCFPHISTAQTFEQRLVNKFCPSLVLDQRDLAQGTTRVIPVCPEPVEIVTDDGWREIMLLPGADFFGSYQVYNNSTNPMMQFQTRDWREAWEGLETTCGDGGVAHHMWRFSPDFGGPGPGCDESGESSGFNDQPPGWGRVYADGNAYTRSGLEFKHTVYAHAYPAPGPDPNSWIIQYWFFYPYNDWISDHEGDWEHIDVQVSEGPFEYEDAELQRVVYYFHESYEITGVNQLQAAEENSELFDYYVVDETHPVVFVGGWGHKSVAGSSGSGPGSHGSYPIYGNWDKVVRVIVGDTEIFSANENVGGAGMYIPWFTIVDNNESDIDGVVVIHNPSEYDFDTDPRFSWLQASTWWGHPEVNSFSPVGIESGNEAPNGPYHQDTWERSGYDVGRFKAYSGQRQYGLASDVQWSPPAALAITSPTDGQPVSDILDIRGTLHYADSVVVEFGLGASPMIWSRKGTSPTSESHVYASTIGTWNTGVVPAGDYSIRVKTHYGNQVFEQSRTVVVTHRTAVVASTGGDFTSIQSALNWAAMGDTVRVSSDQQYYLTSPIMMKETVQLLAAIGQQPEIWGPTGGTPGPTLKIENHEFPCTIEGFVIRHNYFPGLGGSNAEPGAWIDSASPIFRNCIFTGNSADYGGGVRIVANARPVFEDCQFSGNRAGLEGGGISIPNNAIDGSVECYRCTFEDNIVDANNAGAAVSLKTASYGATPSLFFDCKFVDNGVYNVGSYDDATVYLRKSGQVQFINCSFVSNRTVDVVRIDDTSPLFDLCTIADNTGLDGFLGWLSTPTAATIKRSIIASNDGPLAVGASSLTTLISLQESIVWQNTDQGRGPTDAAWAAAGQTSHRIDPAFCHAGSGDYQLYAFSPAAAPAPPNPGYFGERVGAYDVGCVPTADVTVTAKPNEPTRFSTKPWIVVTCPHGDLDTLEVKVDLNGSITRSIDWREIVLDANLDPDSPVDYDTATVFDQSGFLEAQGDAVGPAYVAKIRHPYFGGHGKDTVNILLNGHPLASQAHFEIRSVDMNGSGVVNLADFAQFAGTSGYPSPPKPYNRYCDFAAPEYIIALQDFALFGEHWNHTFPAGSQQLNDEPVESNAGVALQFTEEFQANSHRLYVDVRVENFANVTASLFSMQAGSNRLSFVNWIPASTPLGEPMFAPIIRDGVEELFFGVLVSDTFTGSDAPVGRLVFDVSGVESMEITEDNFVLTAGEVMQDAPEGGLVLASMEGVFARRLDPAAVRIYHNHLEQNFPNPFNPTTTISFSLKNATNVNLTVYDVAGRRVRELVNEHRDRGTYKMVWDGRNDAGQTVASGVYFYKIVAGSFTDTKKMTLLK